MSKATDKRIEKDSNESEFVLRLKAIVETAIDGIITIDENGIVGTMNPAAAQMFGYSEDEVIGQNIKMLMPPPYRGEHDGYMHRYKETGHAKIIGIGREVSGRKKNGNVFPLRLAVSESWIGDTRIFTGIIHDLTEVKAAEEEIFRLNQELEQKVAERTEKLAEVVNQLLKTNQQLQSEIQERKAAEQALLQAQDELKKSLEKERDLNELKSRFVSMASHEFRTPLSTILSSVALISRYQEKDQQPQRDKHIERIKSSVQNLTGILNDFLSLSKLEEGKVLCQPETFVMQDFCGEVLDEVKSLLKNGQQLSHHSPAEAMEVFLDKRHLKNILFNLLSNAIKYSEEDKIIECTLESSGDAVLIRVKDEGIGIPKEDQPYLFTRFFRAHNAINIQGTGLGLNIVKRYVEMMQGKISYQSSLGKGSIFLVQLPSRME